ncbi:MAG: signal recognition particle protein [Acidobacteriota bacterium]
MFERLTERLEQVFKRLRGYGKLKEHHIDEALRQIKVVLLEADVNFKVVREFIAKVSDKSLGERVLESFTPTQQVVKIVRDELIELLGGEKSDLIFSSKVPSIFMLVGLQGCGKTTTAGKLGKWLRKTNHSPLLVSTDVQRPAAQEQIRVVAEQSGLPAFSDNSSSPLEVCFNSVKMAKREGYDVVVVDTAGRMHINQELMDELSILKKELRPAEILFVADAMTGQDAVKSAKVFNENLDVTGIILTKLDGDARGGAALSIKSVTEKPIKFIGVGERYDDLEPFYPDRIVSRILGMGDVLSLIEKAEAAIDRKEAQDLEEKIRKESFTLEDFRSQLRHIGKMGPLSQILSLFPGVSKLKGMDLSEISEGDLKRIEAIINSMTMGERLNHTIINGSRRKRIARGSGTSVQEVNQLLRQFAQTKKMIKQLNLISQGKSGAKLPFPFFDGN